MEGGRGGNAHGLPGISSAELATVFYAGAEKASGWELNSNMLNLAEVLNAMGDQSAKAGGIRVGRCNGIRSVSKDYKVTRCGKLESSPGTRRCREHKDA